MRTCSRFGRHPPAAAEDKEWHLISHQQLDGAGGGSVSLMNWTWYGDLLAEHFFFRFVVKKVSDDVLEAALSGCNACSSMHSTEIT